MMCSLSCSLVYYNSIMTGSVSDVWRLTYACMYIAGAIAVFLFVALAFSGQFNFFYSGVYLVFFIVVMVVFTNFVEWAESFDSN